MRRRSKYWFGGWDEGEGDRLRDLRQVLQGYV
jgi:ribosome modulation factor